jgi:uncharacterized membrane protein
MRHDRLDALRGLAIVWMVVFHFCFDLNHFRLLEPRQNFYTDPFWTVQRTAIVTLFLLCAGAGQAVAVAQGQTWQRFRRRWLQIVACAAAVSAGSALMFPRSWIFFGVLHGIAVMLPLCRLLAGCGALLWPLGAAALLAPSLLAHPAFNPPWWSWTGLVTVKPITEDWVPVLPWLGVMLWGMAGMQAVLRHRPSWLTGPTLAGAAGVAGAGRSRAVAALAFLGQRSLRIYMLHQPLLIGGILAAVWLTRGQLPL